MTNERMAKRLMTNERMAKRLVYILFKLRLVDETTYADFFEYLRDLNSKYMYWWEP